MKYSHKDFPIKDFRRTLMRNNFMHEKYDPNLDTDFAKSLFSGIFDPKVDDIQGISTVNQFILKNRTYKKAI